MKLLSVIVPFYNEEVFLEESVNRLVTELESSSINYEIFLVNDNSLDDSKNIAQNLSNKYQNITLVSKQVNQGKGSCIREVNSILKSDYTIIHDADLEYFPKDIVKMYKIMVKNQKSLILGSRVIGDNKRIKKYSYLVYVNVFLAKLFSFLNNYQVSDISTCYMMMPTKFLNEISIESNSFTIEIELLSKFLKTGNEIIEIPISYEGRLYSEGKKIRFYDGLKIFLRIISMSKFLSKITFKASGKI